MYDPGVFTHSPCAQGFLSHSSSSAGAMKLINPFCLLMAGLTLSGISPHSLQARTDTLSSYIQFEAHVALAAIFTSRQRDASTVHAEVADSLAHVGCDIPSLDNRIYEQ